VPAPKIATINRINATRADRLNDHPCINVIGVAAGRFDGVIGAGRFGLPKVDGRADSAVEKRIAPATTGQSFIHFRCEAPATRNERGFIVSKESQVRALCGEAGVNCRARRAPDRHAPVPH